ITVQNVVTYDVVVSVDNPDFALLPGMTANTRIITEEHGDVLRVPLKALRFTPRGMERPDTRAHPDPPDGWAHDRPGGRHRADTDAGVWVLRDDQPERVPVTTGLTDGTNAEISKGDLQAGEHVIVDEVSSEPAEGRTANSQAGAAARPHFRGF